MMKTIVCVGGGGVGKTSTSAALALALARSGQRVLIVTIDPARRLAGAMGVPISDTLTEVAGPAVGAGSLSALMPDPGRALHTLVDDLFEEDLNARERVRANPLFRALCDAVPGIHELVAMNHVVRAAASGPSSGSAPGPFDVVVIDTAPSRHAVDFVTYPGRLSAVLGSKVVAWLASLARRSAEPPSGLRRWLGRAAAPVETLLARVTGPRLLGDTAALFAELSSARERFAKRAAEAAELLLGRHTTYLLVLAPTAAAREDARFLTERLAQLGHRPRAALLNRSAPAALPWGDRPPEVEALPPALAEAWEHLAAEHAAHRQATEDHAATLARELPGVPQLRLPRVEATAPEVIVGELADLLGPQLATLGLV